LLLKCFISCLFLWSESFFACWNAEIQDVNSLVSFVVGTILFCIVFAICFMCKCFTSLFWACFDADAALENIEAISDHEVSENHLWIVLVFIDAAEVQASVDWSSQLGKLTILVSIHGSVDHATYEGPE